MLHVLAKEIEVVALIATQRLVEQFSPVLQGLKTIGITAGASAPEVLVDEIIDAFRAHYAVTVKPVVLREENVNFKLPRELRDVA